TQCGNVVNEDIGLDTRCTRCGVHMHACAQCVSFDPGSRFECMQNIPARISPKNERNTCTFYAPRTTVERETTTPKVDSGRQAFRGLLQPLRAWRRGAGFQASWRARFEDGAFGLEAGAPLNPFQPISRGVRIRRSSPYCCSAHVLSSARHGPSTSAGTFHVY